MPTPREENAAAAHDGEGQRKGEARWHVYPELAAAGLLRGAYEREGDPSFTVDLRDGVLHIAVEGGSPSPTRPLTETTLVRDDRIGEADSPSREDASPGSCYGSVAGTASGPE